MLRDLSGPVAGNPRIYTWPRLWRDLKMVKPEPLNPSWKVRGQTSVDTRKVLVLSELTVYSVLKAFHAYSCLNLSRRKSKWFPILHLKTRLSASSTSWPSLRAGTTPRTLGPMCEALKHCAKRPPWSVTFSPLTSALRCEL